MFNNEYSGEINEQTVYYQQMMLINTLASRVFGDITTNWQKDARNLGFAIKTFDSGIIRHKDRKYIDLKKRIKAAYRIKLLKYRENNPTTSLTDQGQEGEMRISLDYYSDLYSLILWQLSRKGVLNDLAVRSIEQPTEQEIQNDQKGIE